MFVTQSCLLVPPRCERRRQQSTLQKEAAPEAFLTLRQPALAVIGGSDIPWVSCRLRDETHAWKAGLRGEMRIVSAICASGSVPSANSPAMAFSRRDTAYVAVGWYARSKRKLTRAK